MVDLGGLVVRLKADLKNFTASMEYAGRVVKQFSFKTERHMANASKAIARFAANAAKRIGHFVKRTVQVTTVALGALTVAMAKMAASAEESEDLFERAFGRMAKQARAWSETFSDALGANEYEVRRQAGTLNLMLKSMGQTEQAAFDMSTAMVQLAYDLSSAHDVPVAQAFEKLQSAISGEVEPLKRLGYVVNETTIKTWALNNGLIKQGQELTEGQKVAARFGVIMDRTQAIQGNLAETYNSTTNAVRSMLGMLKETAVEIGQHLLPIVGSAARAFRDWLIDNQDTIVKNISAWIDKLGDFIEFLRTDWKAALTAAKDTAISVFSAMADSLVQIVLSVGDRIKEAMRNKLATEIAVNVAMNLRKEAAENVMKQLGDKYTEITRGKFQKLVDAELERLKEQARAYAAANPPVYDDKAFKTSMKAIGTNLTRDLDRIWAKAPEGGQKTQDSLATTNDKVNELMVNYKKAAEVAAKAMKSTAESTKAAADEVINQVREMIEFVRSQEYLTRRERLQMLKEYETENKQTLTQVAEAHKLLNDEIRKYETARLDGWKLYLTELKDDIQDWAKFTGEKMADAARGIEQSFSNAFYDITMQAESLKDVFNNLATSIQQSLARAFSDMLARRLMGALLLPSGQEGGLLGLGSLFGTAAPAAVPAATMHAGGIAGMQKPDRIVPSTVFGRAPRLHAGLKADEMPAILQKGETVLPKGIQPNNVNVNFNVSAIDAAGVSQFFSRNSKTIASAVDKAMREGHPIRKYDDWG
ncbi:MAG: hypothetical protein ACYSSI_02640 [Planctomycetota bacterium]|jgi:hypothetical protein